MRRVILTGTAVALGDGVLLGTTLALGWPIVAAVCAVAGLVGAGWVATVTPPPRTRPRPSTVTLGLPVRELTSAPEEEVAAATDERGAGIADEPAVAPVAA